MRIATSRGGCPAPRNDMQKEGRVRGCKDVGRKVRGNMPGVSGGKAPVRNDMQKIVALLRVQEGACRGKPATAHEFALSATFPYLSLRGERIATPVCALVRNDMLKTGRCQRLQGRFPAVHRQCPGIVRTGGKFLHVIARSEATWQSVLLR